MRVTRLNSPSSPEVAEWEEDAAVVEAGVDIGVVGMISGVGLLAADEFEALADLFSQVISPLYWAGSSWLLISQLHVLATPLSTPLSSVRCAEKVGFFLDDRRLSR